MEVTDTTRAVNRALVQRAMDGIGALDVDAVSACLHGDLVFDLPYERAVERLDKAGFLALLTMMFDVYERFTINITRTEALESPNRLVAWYEGDCLSRDGTPYQNLYVGFFEVRDGQLIEWTEYDNPLISQEAFASDAG